MPKQYYYQVFLDLAIYGICFLIFLIGIFVVPMGIIQKGWPVALLILEFLFIGLLAMMIDAVFIELLNLVKPLNKKSGQL